MNVGSRDRPQTKREEYSVKNDNCDKMIIAILQDDDFHDVVEDLNTHGFYATVIQSSGGFLKKPSATIMVGLNHEDLPEALEVLKHFGKRTEMEYSAATPTAGAIHPMPFAPAAIPVSCGGVVLFIADVAEFMRF